MSVEDQAEVVAAEQRRIDWFLIVLVVVFVVWVVSSALDRDQGTGDPQPPVVYVHPEATVTP